MTAPRFYCPVTPEVGDTIALPDVVAHHAVRVLRLKNQAQIILFNGFKGQYTATLEQQGKTVYAHIHAFADINKEIPGHLTLAQGLVSAEKMDWIIEKAVETGVSTLIPIQAHRSIVSLNAERLNKKMRHWEKVIQSASAQCGRNRLMQLETPTSLGAFLQQQNSPGPADALLFCHPEASQPLATTLNPHIETVTALVGPEGGWSDEELHTAEQAGAQPVRFGTRVLRTETAGLVMVSAICALQHWE